MIASLDGAVVVDGTSGGLGNANDRQVLLTMRDLADVIVVGAATARGEGYGPPRKRGQRIGVITNSGSVDLSTSLFTSGAGFVIAPSRRRSTIHAATCCVPEANESTCARRWRRSDGSCRACATCRPRAGRRSTPACSPTT